jgi:ribosomal protein L37AE/L43A
MDNSNGGARILTCPFCWEAELRSFGRNSLRCDECGSVLGGALLETLHMIVTLPDAAGGHACECGHPEMRHLPDGVYRCPACGSEVTPISAPVSWKSPDHTEAYWCGWLDGRYGDPEWFTKTPAWPNGKALQTASTTTAATAPATKPVCGRPGSSKPHSTSSRSARADHQVVATLPLTGVVETVPHVGLEVQRISLPEHILLTT